MTEPMSKERLEFLESNDTYAANSTFEMTEEIRRLRDGWDEARSLLAKASAEVERLAKAICPDGTVTDVDGLEDIAVDGAHALEANTRLVSEVKRLKEEIEGHRAVETYTREKLKAHKEAMRELAEFGESILDAPSVYPDQDDIVHIVNTLRARLEAE